MAQIPPVMQIQLEDIKCMIACSVHIGSENLDTGMSRYVHGRNENGMHIIDIRKTFEKLQLAARVIAAINNPKDVCVVGLTQTNSQVPPFAQRAVLKFAKYTGCKAIAGRFTPGSFTNQLQPNFFGASTFDRFRPSQGPPTYFGGILCEHACDRVLQHQLKSEKR